jgi:hypothetical protein
MSFCIILILLVLQPESGEGTIVTYTDSLSGSIQIDLNENAVVLRVGNSYRRYYARDIKKVVLEGDGGQSIYASYPFGLNAEHFLFEQLSAGALSLLYREGLKFSKYDETNFPPFYIAIDGSVYSLGGKKQVLEAMEDEKDLIKEYLRENKVDFEDRNSLVGLFDYYNSL